MIDSILTSVKKILTIVETDTSFDEDIIFQINSVFSTLNQLGVGPSRGFAIEDASTTWDAFLGGNLAYNFVKTYVATKVRLVFDPPTTSFVLSAMQDQIRELEWRINVLRESTAWVEGSMSDPGTIFSVDPSIPLHERIRVKNGKNLWASLDLFEAKMRVRASSATDSTQLQDLSAYLSTSFDGNDIVVDWVMNGSQTSLLVAGYYDIILSDVGDTDDKAIKALSGYIKVGV